MLLYDTKFGDNVVIAAGSIGRGEVPSNSVYGGVPAKHIGSYSDLESDYRLGMADGQIASVARNREITPEELDQAWCLHSKIFASADQSATE